VSGIISAAIEDADLRNPAALLLSCLATLLAWTVVAQTPALVVQNAWVRNAPGADVAAVYLTLRNVSAKPVVLIGVQSPVASHAMLHETKVEGGQSRMRAHDQLVIAPGQTVRFEPGGLHVMLHGLTQPVATGQSVPLVLLLAGGGTVPVVAQVRALNAP
jgi:copper(I)-binding protein